MRQHYYLYTDRTDPVLEYVPVRVNEDETDGMKK